MFNFGCGEQFAFTIKVETYPTWHELREHSLLNNQVSFSSLREALTSAYLLYNSTNDAPTIKYPRLSATYGGSYLA